MVSNGECLKALELSAISEAGRQLFGAFILSGCCGEIGRADLGKSDVLNKS